MLAEERRREILKILKRQGRLSVDELVSCFKVSAVTLRADLGILADKGLLVRSYGGAIGQDTDHDSPLSVKRSLNHAEKVRIAHAAAQLIEPHQTVILDSGTTAAELAKAIRNRPLSAITVVTHAINIAQELINAPHVTVVVIGGVVRHVSASMVGPQAERMLRDLHAHHFFLGVDALTPELNLATPDLLEAQLNTQMIDAAEQTTVIADSSKLGRHSLSNIGHITKAKQLITDAAAAAEMVQQIRAEGVKVTLV